MATVLKEVTTEEQNSVVRILWVKGLSGTDIHEEMFPVYGGKCLSSKAFHSWVAKISLMTKRLKAETTDKRFLCCGFDGLVKRWDRCINVGGGYVAE
jgi:hypothetical protein